MSQRMEHLKIKDKFTDDNCKTNDSLGNLLNLQKDIQENVYGYKFDEIRHSLRIVEKFSTMNYHAIQDELREYFEALGGIDSGGNAIWKPWKKLYNSYIDRPFSSLSPNELKELQFEVIDILHFVFNLAILVKLDSKKLYNMYFAKNKENIDRQKRNY